MAQNTLLINGITYQSVSEIDIPISGGGTAAFFDTTDATLSSGASMLSGVTAYANGTLYTGSISSKAAATYTPTTSDQTIASGQYLSGAQTIAGDANLVAANIADGVSIFGVTGSLSAAVISQNSSTKVLSIS